LATPSAATWKIDASSVVIATNGSATRLTWLPSSLTVDADQMRAKSGWCERDPRLLQANIRS
jgi:hypothetical protein